MREAAVSIYSIEINVFQNVLQPFRYGAQEKCPIRPGQTPRIAFHTTNGTPFLVCKLG